MNKESLPITRKIADAFFDLAVDYEQIKKFDLAIENYQKALDYDSTYMLARYCIDKLSQKQNSSGQAIAV